VVLALNPKMHCEVAECRHLAREPEERQPRIIIVSKINLRKLGEGC
jgi:hypothetical protein